MHKVFKIALLPFKLIGMVAVLVSTTVIVLLMAGASTKLDGRPPYSGDRNDG